jgi:hypothetical protein
MVSSMLPSGSAFPVGQTTTDTASTTGWSGDIWLTPFTAVSSATVMTVGINVAAGSGNIRVALYQDSSGAPGTLLGQSSSTASAMSWNDIAISPTPNVASGTQYWFAVQVDSNSLSFHYATGSAGSTKLFAQAYGTFPNSFSGSSTIWQPTFRDTIQTGPPAGDYSMAANPTSQSIGAGSLATYTINLAAGTGYSNSVTLSLDSSTPCPTGATCTFTPGGGPSSNPIPLSSVASGTFSVQTSLNGYTGTTSLQVNATDGAAHKHNVQVSLTVNNPATYGFNVKSTATQIVATILYSATSQQSTPAPILTIAGPNGSPTIYESGGTSYDRTTILVSGGTTTYNVIHRVTWTITAPGAAQVWTVYVSIAGVSSYTVIVEVT